MLRGPQFSIWYLSESQYYPLAIFYNDIVTRNFDFIKRVQKPILLSFARLEAILKELKRL